MLLNSMQVAGVPLIVPGSPLSLLQISKIVTAVSIISSTGDTLGSYHKPHPFVQE